MRYLSLIALFLLSLSLFSCEIINPAEEIPAYIKVENPRVVLDENTGFSTNAGIRNIWLYHGGEIQGIYQFDPDVDTTARIFPILNLDKYEFFIDPGIYESGQSAYQIPYPFWDRLTFNWQAEPQDTYYLQPVFHYVDDALFVAPVEEHFEGGGISLDPFASGFDAEAAPIVTSTDAPFQGNGIGSVRFDATHRFFEVVSTIDFTTTTAANIFAEVTYKNTIPFTIGLVYTSSAGGTQKTEILNVSENGKWNTVYVHMISEVRSIINAYGANTRFFLWLKADGENKDGYILFDDIRVIREK